MELFIKITLFFHIAAGFTALLTGGFALGTQKGGKNHLLAGKIYYWAMTLVAITALVVAAYKGITFLFLIAIFSYYMTFTGYRTLQQKRLNNGKNVAKVDWIILIISGLTGLAMVLSGIFKLVSIPEAIIVFGVIMLGFSFNDYRYFTGKISDNKEWLYRHIGRMCGAYIATFTAFLVVNVHTNPAFIAWIAPTVIGTPIIAYYIITNRRKFNKV